jgi:hypothetical protein
VGNEEKVDPARLRAAPQGAVRLWEALLADEAAAVADGDRMRPAAGLQLREQVADVRLDGLLREEEALADLSVDEAVGHELEHLDLAQRRLLLELSHRRSERDHLGAAVRAPGRGRLETAAVVQVPAHDLFALSSVHVPYIGGEPEAL